jgi:hypothetical protein
MSIVGGVLTPPPTHRLLPPYGYAGHVQNPPKSDDISPTSPGFHVLTQRMHRVPEYISAIQCVHVRVLRVINLMQHWGAECASI